MDLLGDTFVTVLTLLWCTVHVFASGYSDNRYMGPIIANGSKSMQTKWRILTPKSMRREWISNVSLVKRFVRRNSLCNVTQEP